MKIWSRLSISQTGKETHISFIKVIRWYAIRHRSSLRACLFELLDSFFNMKNQKLKQINNKFLVQKSWIYMKKLKSQFSKIFIAFWVQKIKTTSKNYCWLFWEKTISSFLKKAIKTAAQPNQRTELLSAFWSGRWWKAHIHKFDRVV